MIDSVSTPGMPRWPSTSTITASPSRMCDGKRTISITTLSSIVHALGAGIADGDRLGEHLAVDLHHAHAGAFEVRADEAIGRPLDDFDDPPLDLAQAADAARQPHAHGVAIGRVVRCIWRE